MPHTPIITHCLAMLREQHSPLRLREVLLYPGPAVVEHRLAGIVEEQEEVIEEFAALSPAGRERFVRGLTELIGEETAIQFLAATVLASQGLRVVDADTSPEAQAQLLQAIIPGLA